MATEAEGSYHAFTPQNSSPEEIARVETNLAEENTNCEDCGEWPCVCGTSYGDYEQDWDDDAIFADPGGRSALRAVTPTNPRNQPCPTCERPNMLTPADVALGYQCDGCADRIERGGDF